MKHVQHAPNKNLIVLIGLPNSGKSTKRAELQEQIADLKVMSRDDLLEDFYIRKIGNVDTYNVMYRYLHEDKELLAEFSKEFEDSLNKAAKECSNILIDMTQLSLSTRRKMINHFPKFTKKAIVIMTDNDELYRRNSQRYEETKKFISSKVIENMMTSFTYPVHEEGFDSIELIIN